MSANLLSGTRSGVVCWRGPSQFNREPVAVVLTGFGEPSRNSKTGPMVQAYVVPTFVNAGLAVGTEAEVAACGDCPLRGDKRSRICYVTWGVWVVGRHMAAGRYGEVTSFAASRMLAGMALRIGAYGDPAAVPTWLWEMLAKSASTWTGYTHAWRTCDQELRRYLMASVETSEQVAEARRKGWRTFRIRWPGGAAEKGEVACPAETRGVQCIRCRLCRGTDAKAKDVVITAHGIGRSRFVRRYQQLSMRGF